MRDGEGIPAAESNGDPPAALAQAFPGRLVMAISQAEFVRILRGLSNRLLLGGSVCMVVGEHRVLGHVALINIRDSYYRVA